MLNVFIPPLRPCRGSQQPVRPMGGGGGETGRDGAQLWLGPGGGGRSGSRVEVCPTAGPQSRGIGSCGHLSGPCVRDWSLITEGRG